MFVNSEMLIICQQQEVKATLRGSAVRLIWNTLVFALLPSSHVQNKHKSNASQREGKTYI
jgi:hypothetical protein